MTRIAGNRLCAWVESDRIYRLPTPLFVGEPNIYNQRYIELPVSPVNEAALAMIGHPLRDIYDD